MTQLVYSNSIIISGKSTEVSSQLKELSQKYKTFRELFDSYFKSSSAEKSDTE